MTVSKGYLLNHLILSFGKLSHYNYYAFKNNVESVQRKKLLHYLSHNASTAYGKDYGFKSIKDYNSYAVKVPVIEDWKQLEGYIQRIEIGEQQVLCQDPIQAFEETSGSTGFSKLIPYNKALKKEFQKALHVWMLDLAHSLPQSFYGKSYWSLSPVLKETKYTSGGIRIGLENDAEYFNPVTRLFLRGIMAVDPEISKIKRSNEFYFETMRQLLLTSNLSFISVWSPTFFLQLDRYLRDCTEDLLEAIQKKNPKRFCQLKQLLQGSFTWKDLWPQLGVISCWTDAQASLWIAGVKEVAGKVAIQPKGLLSTEAVVTIPIKHGKYPALAYHSHFFEFRKIDDQTIQLAHQLSIDKQYEVIVTTAGGLYRYATKDVVQVKGFHCQIPLLQFVGRQNRTSDLVGEKLSEIQVNEVLNQIITDSDIKPVLIFLRPQRLDHAALYTLYLEAYEEIDQLQLQELTSRVNQLLCQNPYYMQALQTGQLHEIQYKMLEKGFKEKLQNHYRVNNGVKDGDIKLPILFLQDELKDLNSYL